MSRLRRLELSDRYFFVTCNRRQIRKSLSDDDFEILARVMHARRQEHGFLLTAWVFLSDHWHAILGVRHPTTVSLVVEAIKVASTRRINRQRREAGILWQGRFFDRALRTVKEYNETVEYIHHNPVRRGLVARAKQWRWSSVHEYQPSAYAPPFGFPPLSIDRVRLPADEHARI